MKYYTIVFPGEFGQHVQETWRTDQILKAYWKSWNVKMFQSGNGDLVTEERCLEDWCTTHWAQETDEFGNKLQNLLTGAEIMSDKGYKLATHDQQAEFARKRNYDTNIPKLF